MSMSMDSMSMAATSTAGAAMASMTGMSGATGMDSTSMAMTMSMSEMMMVFFSSTTTPLYSMQWTPTTTGQYAGTCIFLIALAVVFRGILAIRSNFQSMFAWYTHRNETAILRSDFDQVSKEKKSAQAAATAQRPSQTQRPWRINEALVRATLDTCLATVSYLLMLAVMTMNIGYFVSILAGTFVGSFVFGGRTAPASH